MSKLSTILLVSLLSCSAWSEATSRVRNHPPTNTTASTPQSAAVIFQDPMLGSVKMRPIHTPTLKFGAAEGRPPLNRVVVLQRPAVSVAQMTTVRPGSCK